MSVYVCIGDSITHGTGSPSTSWVSLLTNEKENNLEEYNLVYNLGVSSDTSEKIVQRIDSELKARIKEYMDTICIIAVGINDAKWNRIEEKFYVPIELFKKNLLKIVETCNNNNARIILVGLTNVDEARMDPSPWEDISWKKEDVIRYDSVIQEIAKELECDYISMRGLLNTKDLEDGLHPNKNGHTKMYNEIIKVINE